MVSNNYCKMHHLPMRRRCKLKKRVRLLIL
jgi:hypothetical protein